MKDYPVKLRIDYSESSNRLTVFFRLLLVIPILLILSLVATYAEALSFAIALMILFREKYPKWWFEWNVEITRFSYRIVAYFLLMRDEYPATDERQSVHITIPYPDVKNDLKRWMPLIKWFLVLPHIFILIFIFIGAFLATIFAFLIIFTFKINTRFDFIYDFYCGRKITFHYMIN